MMRGKKLCSVVLALVLCALCILPAGAASQAEPQVDSQVERIDLGDGYYLKVYVETDPQTRGSGNTSGSKTGVVYNDNDEELFSATVHGTFAFNGTTAMAIEASYSYDIQALTWSFSSGKAYCSGNSAVAEITFAQLLIFTRTATVILYCTPDGVLY